ncbi:hypothetical protein GGR56DRAFT_208309 [Xylariaceae sp. FL0804]|nr:hypothetical protein GGR56DRAFT_208309 [Xylariaceae sp. FL0804]
MENQYHSSAPPPSPGAPPPAQFLSSSSSVGARRAASDAAFRAKLSQMALPLAPLVQLTTGAVHPHFPASLLGFWLLTDAQLEELAHFYHQRTPCRWTACYPCPVPWSSDLPLEDKRRRLGRFIGLRGCESPVLPVAMDVDMGAEGGAGAGAALVDADGNPLFPAREMSEDEVLDRARRARLAADEEELWRRKFSPWS